jgi:hypothetical protein
VEAFNIAKDKLEKKKKERSTKRKEKLTKKTEKLATKETLAKEKEAKIVNNFMAENGLSTPEQKEEFMEFYRHLKKNNPKDMPTVLKLLKTYEHYMEKKNSSILSGSKEIENLTTEEEYNNRLYTEVMKRFRFYDKRQIMEIFERILVDAGIVGQEGRWHYMLLPPQTLTVGTNA